MHETSRPHVLLVEDEFLLAQALQLLLEQSGARVLGPVPRVSDALELLESEARIDCAMLDVNLEGESSFRVADALRTRGIRFAFLTCYDRSMLPAPYRDAACFSKVDDLEVLIRWMKGAEGATANT
jgi:CheY-like chemotaxis protein